MTKIDHPYYIRHHLSKIAKDADQTELVALRWGQTRASSGVRDDVIADTIDDEPSSTYAGDEESWQTRETSIESATSQIIEELEKRKQALGELYPFSIRGDIVEYSQSDDLLYEFFLCASLSPSLTKGEYRHVPRIFERVVAELTANFLGPNTQFSHIGFPNERRRFKAAVLDAVEKSCELKWKPWDDLPDEGPRTGDEGVDYILWMKFKCLRPIGQPFFFGQCACGNDWETKLGDISNRFLKWFEPLKVQYSKVFSVPFVVPDAKLCEVARDAGIVMDRIRLVQAIKDGANYNPDKWKEKLFEAMCLIAEA